MRTRYVVAAVSTLDKWNYPLLELFLVVWPQSRHFSPLTLRLENSSEWPILSLQNTFLLKSLSILILINCQMMNIFCFGSKLILVIFLMLVPNIAPVLHSSKIQPMEYHYGLNILKHVEAEPVYTRIWS